MEKQILYCGDQNTMDRLPENTTKKFNKITEPKRFQYWFQMPMTLSDLLKDPEAVFGTDTAPFEKNLGLITRECVTPLSECPAAQFIARTIDYKNLKFELDFVGVGYDFFHGDDQIRYYFSYDFIIDLSNCDEKNALNYHEAASVCKYCERTCAQKEGFQAMQETKQICEKCKAFRAPIIKRLLSKQA